MLSQANLRASANMMASYANVGLMALITVLVIPVYVHTLGPSQWGAVALCVTLQGVLFAVDVAVAPLMLRNVARAAMRGQALSVYRRFLRLYASVALIVIALAELALALSDRWIDIPTLPLEKSTTIAVQVALTQFLFQFSNNAAIGYWNGLERQRLANFRLALFQLMKHGLALWAVLLWESTAIAYLSVFATVSAVEFFVNFGRVYGEKGGESAAFESEMMDDSAETDGSTKVSGWRGLGAYGVAGALGVATTQVDRLYLSFALPAEQFGVYFLVCTLMLSMLSLQVPIQRAFLPQIATADKPRVPLVSMLKVSFALVVLPCVLMALFPEFVLRLWLGDSNTLSIAAAPFRLNMLSVALLAISAPMSILLLGQARYLVMMMISGSVLVAQLLVLIILTPKLGMLAGGLAWLSCGAIQAGCTIYLWRRTTFHPLQPGSRRDDK